jgi:Pyruvate/2-oxoacid:ferredoxin oxidoreductase delta subunit
MNNQFNVEWSSEKCPRPQDCGKCMQICPEAVFALYAPNREKGIAPDEYVISPAMQFFCTGCAACVDVCPKKAIRVVAKAPAS